MKNNFVKKIFTALLSACLVVPLMACGSSSGSSASGSSSDKTVNIIAWASMFTDSQVQAIKKATGITVNATPFNSLEELYTKLRRRRQL